MNIIQIYENYKIPQNLQLHMLRVAAVGNLIADNWKNETDIDKTVLLPALLLHDMGNIIKFDLSQSQKFSSESIEVLKDIQKEFKEKYGNEEHTATTMIAKEIGVSDHVLDILTKKGKSSTHDSLLSKDWNNKIKGYSDLRIDPFGVVSLSKRFEDVLIRYKNSGRSVGDKTEMAERYALAQQLEKEIQEKILLNLQAITNEQIAPYIEALKGYSVWTKK